jgi:hypothetical protein
VLELDIATPVLTFLLVEGDLFFDRNKDVSIDSFYIYIRGGYFEVGTAEEPFEKSAVITLHGTRYGTIEIPHLGSKVLGVSARGTHAHGEHATGEYMSGRDMGQLEVHGAPRLRTWTFINESTVAGQSWLRTKEAVDYQMGEVHTHTYTQLRLLLHSLHTLIQTLIHTLIHTYTHTYTQVVVVTGGSNPEEMTVLATNGYNVTFTAPLRFSHPSEYVVIEGRHVDMRAQIGLLSRNVIIQGRVMY